jgi:hypothetical protein
MPKNMKKHTQQIGEFGPIYTQFKGKPKDAIKHLMRIKKGDCINAYYHEKIGWIDIIWGENDSKTNKGYGLKHIIEKHGEEIKQLGFDIPNFITMVLMYGEFRIAKPHTKRVLLENKHFRIVISMFAYKNSTKMKKTFVLTAFDLRPIKKKPVNRE